MRRWFLRYFSVVETGTEAWPAEHIRKLSQLFVDPLSTGSCDFDHALPPVYADAKHICHDAID
jgi:hypothetical protein